MRRSVKRLAITAGIGILAYSVTALAAHWRTVPDSETITAVSGSKGKSHADANGASNIGLAGFSWVEEGNKPCELTLDYSFRQPPQSWTNPTHTFEQHGCGGMGKSKHSVRVDNPSDQWVYAVQVCLNGGGDRLKGIRIWPATLRSTGELFRSNTYVQKRLTNCTNWRPKVECGPHKVAKGAEVHYTDTDGYMGIALKCRTQEFVR